MPEGGGKKRKKETQGTRRRECQAKGAAEGLVIWSEEGYLKGPQAQAFYTKRLNFGCLVCPLVVVQAFIC